MPEVAQSVKSVLEVLEVSNAAWNAVPQQVFRSAWIVCGYFAADDFNDVVMDGPPVKTVEDAHHVLDPCGVLQGTKIDGTPQFCATMEWQIQDTICSNSCMF